jgi:hypothetical protein
LLGVGAHQAKGVLCRQQRQGFLQKLHPWRFRWAARRMSRNFLHLKPFLEGLALEQCELGRNPPRILFQ